MVSSISNLKGIDVQNVNKITNELFASLENKTVDYNKVDLTRFTRTTQGVDLYSTKQSLELQRQVAMQNAGLFNQEMTLPSVQALNASAAASVYSPKSVENAVEGKMTIGVNAEMATFQEVTELAEAMNVFETYKDKKGSNPFAFVKNDNEEKEETASLNLFA